MIPFLKELNKEFKTLCDNNFLEFNPLQTIVYPYLTYTIQSEDLENQEGFYIDVDIYDNKGPDTTVLEVLSHNIKKHFKEKDIITNDIFLQFEFQSSRMIPTQSDKIRHRWIQLYCKTDWRE